MATQTRLPVIDADAHVIETERTWDYLEPSEQQFRPLLYASPQDPTRVLHSQQGLRGSMDRAVCCFYTAGLNLIL